MVIEKIRSSVIKTPKVEAYIEKVTEEFPDKNRAFSTVVKIYYTISIKYAGYENDDDKTFSEYYKSDLSLDDALTLYNDALKYSFK